MRLFVYIRVYEYDMNMYMLCLHGIYVCYNLVYSTLFCSTILYYTI